MFPKKLKEENYDYWKDYSIMSNRFIVFFGEHVLDLTQFLLENPKGFPFFNNYALMNIEPLFTKKKK